MGLRLSKIPESDRKYIKSNIFDVLEKSQPTAQQQIIEMIVSIVKFESPQNWPLLMQKIKESTMDPSLCNLYLEIANSLFERYRFALASDHLYREIEFVVAQLSTRMTSIFMAFTNEMTSSLSDKFIALNHCVNIFHYRLFHQPTAISWKSLVRYAMKCLRQHAHKR